ncbi:MAG: hypothetical protein NC827_05935 [Candidatus Omnitrophica bacterium]|nr:hypothetical protein [Candidatus Omnitrophota bacterium]
MVLCPKHKVLLEKLMCLKYKGVHIPAFSCPVGGEVYSYIEIYGIDGLKNYFYTTVGEELTKTDLEYFEKFYKKWLKEREVQPLNYYIEIEKELAPEEIMKLMRRTPENVVLMTLMARMDAIEKIIVDIKRAISDILEALKKKF